MNDNVAIPADTAYISLEAACGYANESRNATISDFAPSPTAPRFAVAAPAATKAAILRVVGLEPGVYEVVADGGSVGKWPTQLLSAGVDLELTPLPRAWSLARVGDEPRAVCREAEVVAGHAPSWLPEGGKWKLAWHDEFDGTELDAAKWGYRTTFWGMDAPWFAKPGDGAVEVHDGCAHLRILKKADGQFVSPQLQTGELVWDYPHDPERTGFWPLKKRQPPRFVHRYGYYECRFRLQRCPGWWSAFWMQTETQGCCLDPARCGIEHDVMESFVVGDVMPQYFHMHGYGPDHVMFNSFRSYRYPPEHQGPNEYLDAEYTAHVGARDFVNMGLLWEPDGYTIFLNGKQHGYKLGQGRGEAVSAVPEFILISTEPMWYRQGYRDGQAHGKPVPELAAAVAAGDAFVVDYVRVFDRA